MPRQNIEATFSGLRAVVGLTRCRLTMTLNNEDERGAGLIEYALLLVLVLLVAFGSILLFGETIVGLFEFAATTFDPTPATP